METCTSIAQAYLQELISIDKKQSNITADNNEEHPSSTNDDIDSEEESAMDSIELDQDQDETGSEIDSYITFRMPLKKATLLNHYLIFHMQSISQRSMSRKL